MKAATLASAALMVVVWGLVAGCAPMVSVGSEGRLYEEGLTSISVALTEDAFDEMTRAVAANDLTGFAEVILSGRAVRVSNGTDVLVLRKKLGKMEVRILTGPNAGIKGWVNSDWVRSK